MDGTTVAWKYFFDNSDENNCEISTMSIQYIYSSGNCGNAHTNTYVKMDVGPLY